MPSLRGGVAVQHIAVRTPLSITAVRRVSTPSSSNGAGSETSGQGAVVDDGHGIAAIFLAELSGQEGSAAVNGVAAQRVNRERAGFRRCAAQTTALGWWNLASTEPPQSPLAAMRPTCSGGSRPFKLREAVYQ